MSNHYGLNRDRGSRERSHRTNPWIFPIEIGFYAGLFFGTLRWICFKLNFTKIITGFLLDSFFGHDFLQSGWGVVAGIVSFIVFSIVAAFLYKVALGRLKGPWPGIFYGFGWWAILFGLIGPLLGLTGWLHEIGWNTFFTELCILTVWGLFIGFSIAFEFTDEASREPLGA